MGEVDPAFFQAPEHRPSLQNIEAQGIPLIDLSIPSSPDASLEDLVKKIGDACRDWGFFKAYKNVRDWKEVFDFAVQNPTIVPASYEPDDKEVTEWYNQWPEYPPELRPTTFIRLNHYPPCPVPDLALGVGRHKDAVALTILAQDDVGGLEVKSKSDGEWTWVTPTPNSYIINVGDIIQVWSNDAYESVEHRVKVNPEKERFSVPYFLNPAHYTWVKPLEEIANEQNPAKYRPYNLGKFFVTRKRSNFKKLDVENIQISHLRVSDLSDKFEGALSINP
ncbi:hypothetical protein GH714_007394 [Hevea brasiliensis]|uniref:Fe2OG dioxygenase domain-containing protein n=1 Tax=Hevea brasiliensis TaxID=3981 RepID=A0A6A6LF42_HEVBR|nr:hypothetical protein GH714_007394 [Hevea brasiliensis]